MSENTLNESGIKKRYAWHLSQVIFVLFLTWGYSVYGTAFVQVPTEYQWILALLNPFVRDFYSKLYAKVALKASGEEYKDKRSIKLLVAHYVSTKHAIFLAIIVGGVATPASSICIMGTDFAKTLHTTWKMIRKAKQGSNIEGNTAKYMP